ncbi:MAG: Xaa-Pro aminopeptidase [Bdellovibrionota bacterium]
MIDSTAAYYRARRTKLLAQLPGRTVLLSTGEIRLRNITASGYPFRANSHFLYFCGDLPPGSYALLNADGARVFVHQPSVSEQVWEGPIPPTSVWCAKYGLDSVESVEQLDDAIAKIPREELTSLPQLDAAGAAKLARLLGRTPSLDRGDRELALAVIECRLEQDDLSIDRARSAAGITAAAFRAGMRQTRVGVSGYHILAAMEAELLKAGAVPAFPTTLTDHGEVLHNPEIADRLDGELVLADLGAELRGGDCADVTRVWPVAGKFSSEARELYELVLSMQTAAIGALRPGVLYGDVHLAACKACVEGLISLKMVRGNADDLFARNVHSLFFPHGIGHLLGLDVHDMEDLGDLAGYADGQVRDSRFGWNFLRLNRRLRPRMLVTIEPGMYWIPALLESSNYAGPLSDVLCRDQIQRYRHVRGIRIEDDLLITESGSENLTSGIPKTIEDVESLVTAER